MRQMSQDEIDALFRSRRGAEMPEPENRALPFDFEKPDRIPKSQLRAIHYLYDNFTRALTSALSGYLRAYTSGSLISVEQMPYSAFLDTLPENTCVVPLAILPYGDHAILEISPSLIFAILQILLGGKANSGTVPTRELSDMERFLLTDFFTLITTDLDQCWKDVDEVQFQVELREARYRVAKNMSPSGAIVAIGMEFRVDDTVGMMNLAIPSITMKTMVQKFDGLQSIKEPSTSESEQELMLEMLETYQVDVEPRFTARLRVRDLLALESGCLITLDHPANHPIVATANGHEKFCGELIASGAEFYFRIDKVKDLARTNPKGPVTPLLEK